MMPTSLLSTFHYRIYKKNPYQPAVLCNFRTAHFPCSHPFYTCTVGFMLQIFSLQNFLFVVPFPYSVYINYGDLWNVNNYIKQPYIPYFNTRGPQRGKQLDWHRRHGVICQHQAGTGLMLSASAQYRPAADTQRHVDSVINVVWLSRDSTN